MNKKYAGVVVPMITPLTKERKIDVNAVERIMKLFAENNISPLVLGTTGESSSVGKAESLVFVEAAVKYKGAGQTIYAGLVGNNEEELFERAELYAKAGADVVVATLPAYYILTPEQMEGFYTRLADKSSCPIMMYNIKATTQMTIPLDVVNRLSKHSNIAGLKDSERDFDRMMTCIETYKNNPDFSYFCGWGAQGFNSLRMGADGIVPSTGNIAPEMYKALYDAYKKGDNISAEKYQEQTDKVAVVYQKDRTLGESLAALKVLMTTKNICQAYMMPPLSELSSEQEEIVKKNFSTLTI